MAEEKIYYAYEYSLESGLVDNHRRGNEPLAPHFSSETKGLLEFEEPHPEIVGKIYNPETQEFSDAP